MSALPVLEVAIGLSFTYLLLALIASTLAEWISRFTNARGNMLEEGIRQLLGEEDAQGAVTEQVLNHPLIRPLAQRKKATKRRAPSYIPSDLFAKALKAIVTPSSPVSSTPKSAALGQALAALGGVVGEGGSVSEASLAKWYDQHMDRVSGWYKRHTQSVVLAVAIVLTVVTNADTVGLIHRLWTDSALRAAVVEAAKARIAEGPPLRPVEYSDPTTPKPTKPIQSSKANEVGADEVQLLSRMVGWSEDLENLKGLIASGTKGEVLLWFVLHLFGWFVTALAVSIGAPFWFDTLNRLMNIRSSGPAPKEASDAK